MFFNLPLPHAIELSTFQKRQLWWHTVNGVALRSSEVNSTTAIMCFTIHSLKFPSLISPGTSISIVRPEASFPLSIQYFRLFPTSLCLDFRLFPLPLHLMHPNYLVPLYYLQVASRSKRSKARFSHAPLCFSRPAFVLFRIWPTWIISGELFFSIYFSPSPVNVLLYLFPFIHPSLLLLSLAWLEKPILWLASYCRMLSVRRSVAFGFFFLQPMWNLNVRVQVLGVYLSSEAIL